MNATPPRSVQRCTKARRHGFTMLEVMLAMGIFAIGFVAVASIFPVAVLLQKQTSDDFTSQVVARNAKAMLAVRNPPSPLATYMGGGNWDTDQQVYPIPSVLLTGPVPPPWTLADRSYPTAAFTNAAERQFYWVPLVLDNDLNPGTQSWRTYAFILRRGDNATYSRSDNGAVATDWVNYDDGYVDAGPAGPDPSDYWIVPGVRKVTVSASGSNRLDFATGFSNDMDGDGVADQVAVGDEVLDNNGNVHKVFAADALGFSVSGYLFPDPKPVTEIWFSPPSTAGRPSPVRRIILLTEPFN